jgi:hypothetical protein
MARIERRFGVGGFPVIDGILFGNHLMRSFGLTSCGLGQKVDH